MFNLHSGIGKNVIQSINLIYWSSLRVLRKPFIINWGITPLSNYCAQQNKGIISFCLIRMLLVYFSA